MPPRAAARTLAPRRTQAERRAATRDRLLDATIDCLVERGYAGTTTAELETRAGVSRGARLHHFPTKAALLSAAVDHLFLGLRRSFEASIRSALGGDRSRVDRFDTAFRLLWSSLADPRGAAVFELFMAARGDPELRERLREVAERHHVHMQRRAAAYFPEASPEVRARTPEILESIHAAMQGLALRRVVFGEDATEKLVLDAVKRMAGHWISAIERGES